MNISFSGNAHQYKGSLEGKKVKVDPKEAWRYKDKFNLHAQLPVQDDFNSNGTRRLNLDRSVLPARHFDVVQETKN